MDYRACRQRRNPKGGHPFTNWTRVQRGLESNTRVGYVATDLDLVWYNYVKAKLSLLELKLGEEGYPASQRTTYSVLDQMLRSACSHPGFALHTPKGCLPIPSRVDYCGHHLIRLENASSDEMNVWKGEGRIWIDETPASKEQLLRFLKFEWMPNAPIPLMIQDSHLRSSFHEHVYDGLENLLKDCTLHGDLQEHLDNIKDLVMRYDSILDNRRLRKSRAKKRNPIMIEEGQLMFGWNGEEIG